MLRNKIATLHAAMTSFNLRKGVHIHCGYEGEEWILFFEEDRKVLFRMIVTSTGLVRYYGEGSVWYTDLASFRFAVRRRCEIIITSQDRVEYSVRRYSKLKDKSY